MLLFCFFNAITSLIIFCNALGEVIFKTSVSLLFIELILKVFLELSRIRLFLELSRIRLFLEFIFLDLQLTFGSNLPFKFTNLPLHFVTLIVCFPLFIFSNLL